MTWNPGERFSLNRILVLSRSPPLRSAPNRALRLRRSYTLMRLISHDRTSAPKVAELKCQSPTETCEGLRLSTKIIKRAPSIDAFDHNKQGQFTRFFSYQIHFAFIPTVLRASRVWRGKTSLIWFFDEHLCMFFVNAAGTMVKMHRGVRMDKTARHRTEGCIEG